MGEIEALHILKKELGEKRVLSSPEELLVYSYDASRNRGSPGAVIFPRNSREVSLVLKTASDHGVPVYTRGAGTGMAGGSIPEKRGVALVLTEMNRILDIDTSNLTARVQPGVILNDLKAAVEEKGLFYPPDPASAKFATIGGSVAVNSGGLNSIKYGVTKDYVLSLEAVNVKGEILHFGASTMKSVTGYDMTRLLVGSEGTLAVITEAVLKLIPKPVFRETLVAAFSDDEHALDAAMNIVREPLIPSALEFLDETAVYCAVKFRPREFLENAGGVLLVEFDDDSIPPDSRIPDVDIAERLCKEAGAVRLERSADPERREELWEIRRCLSPAVYEIAPTKMNEDICVPRSRLKVVIGEIKRIAREQNIHVVNFAHAGDGNIHVNFMYDGDDPDERERTNRAADRLFRMTIENGGTISGEHGIGITKKKYLSVEYGEEEIRIMRDIRKLFDPAGILNPDKIF